ncbi:hypothetical protein [Bradyrhizobium sp. SZCCHNRI2049]|uniref:hypothetical protein n=1 Tax=Bradyrhizobium sp. SZCCHNRI2049 TaxID=3057287 RepID=UPI0029169741|nr:hypothetical protein [Bradyrhizobium sp. SZCCHNRI2049]
MERPLSNHAQRRMHTLALSLGDSLNEYLDDHEGFVTKAALMTAALKHFKDCHLAKYRDVNEGQTGRAYALVETWLAQEKSSCTITEFLFLLESIPITCRFDVRSIGDHLLVNQVAKKLDINLLHDSFAIPTARGGGGTPRA